MSRIIVSSPPYSESVGGIVVLHKLCHILNTIGFDAYIYPLPRFHDPNNDSYVVNPRYKYKIPTEIDVEKDIVVYPEIQEGNPIGTKNVVRYLLNRHHLPQPGSNVMATWGDGDFWLYHDITWYDGHREKNILTVRENKMDIFKDYGMERTIESCHTYRKKHDKVSELSIIHPKDSIEIPFTVSDEELVKLFNVCKRFYSYDTETYLSVLAVFCGCESITVPYKDLKKHEVGVQKYGVAYGLEDLDYARSTRDQLIQQETKIEEDQYDQTKIMFEKIFKHFNLSK